ncbi:MAG: YHYH protein [Gemmatimonadaceae bacterium]|nr:YHYH protein [Gemmatimonadaceae bacterium]
MDDLGAALFNPYEGDGSTVANADNVSYTFTDNSGVQRTASFIDSCGGHSTPVMAGSATYHYHGWSSYLTQAAGDVGTAASHIIGVALDGYPIYGDRDVNGALVDVSRLDACTGITSPTPEFPNGVYHYVLPSGAASRTAQSAPRCYRGTVSSALLTQISANIGYCWGAPANLSAVAATGTVRRRVGG